MNHRYYIKNRSQKHLRRWRRKATQAMYLEDKRTRRAERKAQEAAEAAQAEGTEDVPASADVVEPAAGG